MKRRFNDKSLVQPCNFCCPRAAADWLLVIWSRALFFSLLISRHQNKNPEDTRQLTRHLSPFSVFFLIVIDKVPKVHNRWVFSKHCLVFSDTEEPLFLRGVCLCACVCLFCFVVASTSDPYTEHYVVSQPANDSQAPVWTCLIHLSRWSYWTSFQVGRLMQ